MIIPFQVLVYISLQTIRIQKLYMYVQKNTVRNIYIRHTSLHFAPNRNVIGAIVE